MKNLNNILILILVGLIGCSGSTTDTEQPFLKDSEGEMYKFVFQINAYDPEGKRLTFAIAKQDIPYLFKITEKGTIYIENDMIPTFASREQWVVKVQVKDKSNITTEKDIIINVRRTGDETI